MSGQGRVSQRRSFTIEALHTTAASGKSMPKWLNSSQRKVRPQSNGLADIIMPLIVKVTHAAIADMLEME